MSFQMLFGWVSGKTHPDAEAFLRILRPDGAPVGLNDLFYDGKAKPETGLFCALRALKGLEDPFKNGLSSFMISPLGMCERRRYDTCWKNAGVRSQDRFKPKPSGSIGGLCAF